MALATEDQYTFVKLPEEEEKFIRNTIGQVGYTFYLTNALRRRYEKRTVLIGKFGQGYYVFNAEYKRYAARWIKLNLIHNHYILGEGFGDITVSPTEIYLGIKEGVTIYPYKEDRPLTQDTLSTTPPSTKKPPEVDALQSQVEDRMIIKKEKEDIYLMTQRLSKKKKVAAATKAATAAAVAASPVATQFMNQLLSFDQVSEQNSMSSSPQKHSPIQGSSVLVDGNATLLDSASENLLLASKQEDIALENIIDKNRLSQLGLVPHVDLQNIDASSRHIVRQSSSGASAASSEVALAVGIQNVDKEEMPVHLVGSSMKHTSMLARGGLGVTAVGQTDTYNSPPPPGSSTTTSNPAPAAALGAVGSSPNSFPSPSVTATSATNNNTIPTASNIATGTTSTISAGGVERTAGGCVVSSVIIESGLENLSSTSNTMSTSVVPSNVTASTTTSTSTPSPTTAAASAAASVGTGVSIVASMGSIIDGEGNDGGKRGGVDGEQSHVMVGSLNPTLLQTLPEDGGLSLIYNRAKKTFKKKFTVSLIMNTGVNPIVRTDICIDKYGMLYFFRKSELYSVDLKNRQVSLMSNIKQIKNIFIKEIAGKDYIIIICKQKIYYIVLNGTKLGTGPVINEVPVKMVLFAFNNEVYSQNEGMYEKIDIEKLLFMEDSNYVIERSGTKPEQTPKFFRKNYFVEPITFPRGSPITCDSSTGNYVAIDKNGGVYSINLLIGSNYSG